MADEIKQPTNKTKGRYDLFVDFYLQSFNATKAAVSSGYSEKTARQQGHKLLTIPYIKEKIQIEMKRLRERMKDEGLRSFSMLLGIAIDTEEKIQKHNVAEIEIERLNELIDNLSLELIEMNRQIKSVQRSADAIDGRKANLKEHKRELLSLDTRSFEIEIERGKLFNERAKGEIHHLPTKNCRI